MMFLIFVKKIMGIVRMHIVPVIVIIALAITIPLVSFAIYSNSTEISTDNTEVSEPTRNIIAATQVSETEESTTRVPTTEVPTTQATSTTVSTTEVPTTKISSKKAPTTKAPTTEVPTTQMPTTTVPTTQVPTTKASTTEVATTQVATTQVPTTQAPTTQVPTTVVPTTQSPEEKSSIEPESSCYILVPESDEYENGIYLGTFILKAYCPCDDCSKGWKKQISLYDTPVSGHTVACNSLPPGTWIYIEGLGEFQVEYTVDGLAPNVIGIFFNYHWETEAFGTQLAPVYLMAY